MERDPFYRDFLYPRGYGCFCGTIITPPTGDLLVFSVERRRSRGHFEPVYVELLNRLRPHLGRAALISARLAFERAQAMTQVLEAVGLPGAVLTDKGRLYAANPLFQALLPIIVQDRERLAERPVQCNPFPCRRRKKGRLWFCMSCRSKAPPMTFSGGPRSCSS
jgi:hypothetical protein